MYAESSSSVLASRLDNLLIELLVDGIKWNLWSSMALLLIQIYEIVNLWHGNVGMSKTKLLIDDRMAIDPKRIYIVLPFLILGHIQFGGLMWKLSLSSLLCIWSTLERGKLERNEMFPFNYAWSSMLLKKILRLKNIRWIKFSVILIPHQCLHLHENWHLGKGEGSTLLLFLLIGNH